MCISIYECAHVDERDKFTMYEYQYENMTTNTFSKPLP